MWRLAGSAAPGCPTSAPRPCLRPCTACAKGCRSGCAVWIHCGSEFMNTALISYCAEQHITFTRGRPYRKNDGCFVEQKNWAVVRRLVGYQRLEAAALPALEHVHDLARV